MKKIVFQKPSFYLKKLIPFAVAIAVYLVISVLFFSPLIEGKKLNQHDIHQGKGMSKEIVDHRESAKEEPLWTGSMFSGMPAYQISVIYPNNIARKFVIISRMGMPTQMGQMFWLLLGFFILLLAFDVNPWLAILGGIAFGLSSYFVIIMGAGHNTKASAISYMAPYLAGVVYTYRKKFMLGAVLSVLFLSMHIYSNHFQITYYLIFIVFVFVVTEFISMLISNKKIDKKEAKFNWKNFIIASCIVVLTSIIALMPSITNVLLTKEYTAETIRGKSELTIDTENASDGLDKDYALAWSYGVGETFSLMIPNIKGGESKAIGGLKGRDNKKAISKVDKNYADSVKGSSQYWGNQPFTSGPVYAGAIICFLFVFGMFIVKGRYKWFLFAITIISFIFAWGSNIMAITDLFFNVLPGYNKFRAVSTALVIAELSIPLLAILALKEIFSRKGDLWKEKKIKTGFIVALSSTAGLSLLFLMFPGFFDFFSTGEIENMTSQYKNYLAQQGADQQQIAQFMGTTFNDIIDNLEIARIAIFKADVGRTIIFILLAAALIFAYLKGKIKSVVVIPILALLIFIDMFAVDKRYINNDDFVKAQQMEKFQASTADLQILEDTDPNYRVYNASVNTFNDASTSYFHKSIGGYHAAKLRRYQELIENQIANNNFSVLNMLNTKYFIMAEEGQIFVQQNPDACGNAWFVDSCFIVENADQELSSLTNFNPNTTCYVDKRFAAQLEEFNGDYDSNAKVDFISYEPNELVYNVDAGNKEGLLVMSEIYYDKGWNAYLDGVKVPYFRANYVLRAMIIPEGNHELVYKFEPKNYKKGETIALIGSILIILIFLISFASLFFCFKDEEEENIEVDEN